VNPILLTPFDIAIASSLIILDAGLSLMLRLRLQRQIALAAARMVVQLLAIGYVLQFTAIRPQPWFDPHYAIPLAGIILGNVLNSASLALDSFLGSVRRERAAIEARLALGASYREAIAPLVRDAIRRGLLPIINQIAHRAITRKAALAVATMRPCASSARASPTAMLRPDRMTLPRAISAPRPGSR
jgi:UDP-glucose/iron transport system permease protein